MAGPGASFDQEKVRRSLASAQVTASKVPATASGGQSNSSGLAVAGQSSGLGNAQLAAFQGGTASRERDVSPGGASQPIAAGNRIGPREALVLARNLLHTHTQVGREDVREFKRIREEGEWDFAIGGISDWLGSATHDVTPTTLGDYDHVDALVEEATDAGRRLQWPTCGRLLSEATTELERLERQMAEAREGAEAGAELAVDLLHMVQGLAVLLVAVPIGTAAGVAVAGEAAATAGLFSTAGLATASATAGVTAGYGMVFESAGQLATRGAIDPAAVAKRGLTEFVGNFFGHYVSGVLTKSLGDWLGRYVSRELLASGLPVRALSEGERFAVELLSGAFATPFTTALGVVTARFVGDSPWPTPDEFVKEVMLEIPKGVLMSVLMQAAPRPAMAASKSPRPVGAIPVSKPAKVARTTETTASPAQATQPANAAAGQASLTPEGVIALDWLAQNKLGPPSPSSEARLQLPPQRFSPPTKTEQPIETSHSGPPEQKAPGVTINLHEPSGLETPRSKGVTSEIGAGPEVIAKQRLDQDNAKLEAAQPVAGTNTPDAEMVSSTASLPRTTKQQAHKAKMAELKSLQKSDRPFEEEVDLQRTGEKAPKRSKGTQEKATKQVQSEWMRERSAKQEAKRLLERAKSGEFGSSTFRNKQKRLAKFKRLLKATNLTDIEQSKIAGDFNEYLTTSAEARANLRTQQRWASGAPVEPGMRIRPPGKKRPRTLAKEVRSDVIEPRRLPDGTVRMAVVEQKSDNIHDQPLRQAVATARKYTRAAIQHAISHPTGRPFVMKYTYTPADEGVRAAMANAHFVDGSPIVEVHFGTLVYRKTGSMPPTQ